MEFKDIFRNLRISKNLNQVEIAKILKLSRSTISMWESGERTPPFERIEEIADFFNVDIDYLMGRTQKTTFIPDSLELTKTEREIISSYRKADDIDKAIVLRTLHLDEKDTGEKNKLA